MENYGMSDSQVYTPEENARDAAKWRELCGKVKHCLDESPNGYTDIWGGRDNLSASVQWQSKGKSGMELKLLWTAENEIRWYSLTSPWSK
jgi:hypothetical protein